MRHRDELAIVNQFEIIATEDEFEKTYDYVSKKKYSATDNKEVKIAELLKITNFFFEEDSRKIVVIAEDENTKSWFLKLKIEQSGLPSVKVMLDDTNLERCNIKVSKRKTEYRGGVQVTIGNEVYTWGDKQLHFFISVLCVLTKKKLDNQ